MKTSSTGLNLIKNFEGVRFIAYKCPAGVWTIGYGHTGKVDGKIITQGMTIQKQKAEELLTKDLAVFESAISKAVKVKLNQSQFDTLVSFAFNVGVSNFIHSTLLKLLNQGKYSEVPAQLLIWNKIGTQESQGLTRRRKTEAKLWQTGKLEFVK